MCLLTHTLTLSVTLVTVGEWRNIYIPHETIDVFAYHALILVKPCQVKVQ